MTQHLKEIKELRKAMGLRDVKIGKRKCLKCDATFESQDKQNIRMCDYCRQSKEV